MHLEISSVQLRPFCPGADELYIFSCLTLPCNTYRASASYKESSSSSLLYIWNSINLYWTRIGLFYLCGSLIHTYPWWKISRNLLKQVRPPCRMFCSFWRGSQTAACISARNNTLRPIQDGHHFTGDIFKWILVNENIWISIYISLKFVPMGPINNIPSLFQIMAWHRPSDKPLSKPIVVSLLPHVCVTRLQWITLRVRSIYP